MATFRFKDGILYASRSVVRQWAKAGKRVMLESLPVDVRSQVEEWGKSHDLGDLTIFMLCPYARAAKQNPEPDGRLRFEVRLRKSVMVEGRTPFFERATMLLRNKAKAQEQAYLREMVFKDLRFFEEPGDVVVIALYTTLGRTVPNEHEQ